MKQLRRTCLGLLMLLALSVPALAGDMGCPPVAGPQESPGLAGEMSTPPVAYGIIHNPPPGDILNPPGPSGVIHNPDDPGDLLTSGIALFFAGFF
jgi:hypothetical protein